jgi:DNA invertase Pin-like site-specific DNA recombinase
MACSTTVGQSSAPARSSLERNSKFRRAAVVERTVRSFLEANGTRVIMLVGYARTSTLEQEAGLEAQLRELRGLGCEKVFFEQASSVGPRKALEQALAFTRECDTLVVTKLDRLARSVPHMWEIIRHLDAKAVGIRILNLGIDTTTPTGRLMLNVLGGVAAFEREMMLERQREGIAKAKAEGKYRGRKPTARAKADQIKLMHAQGTSLSEIARRLEIGKASVHRVLAQHG